MIPAVADDIVMAYGPDAFLADVDRDRQFWREADHVVADALSWAADEGFAEFMARHVADLRYPTAHAFRQRHVLNAILSRSAW